MGGQSREGVYFIYGLYSNTITNAPSIGGKVKPLKSAKKDKKELDEDDLAFKEKQRAGMFPFAPRI